MSKLSNENATTKQLTLAALLAALYAVLTMVLYAPSYGPIQFRFSEALTLLPFLIPGATPGLFAGCLIANLISPYGPIDVIFGSAATLIAALWTSRVKNRWLAPLPPTICNAVIVGATIAYAETGFGAAFASAFAFNALTVGAGELVVCYCLGLPLLAVLCRIPAFRALIPQERLERVASGRYSVL